MSYTRTQFNEAFKKEFGIEATEEDWEKFWYSPGECPEFVVYEDKNEDNILKEVLAFLGVLILIAVGIWLFRS